MDNSTSAPCGSTRRPLSVPSGTCPAFWNGRLIDGRPILALEEELDVALRSARRLRAAGLADQADAGLRFAASLVRELCSLTGAWPEALREVSA